MIRSTPHAHTTYADGKSSVDEMIRSAIAKGFSSIGFSEHAIQSFDEPYCLNAEGEARYIAEVNRLRGEYADRIAVYLGCERDSESTADRSKFEYVIGSVHYMPHEERMVGVDMHSQDLVVLVRENFGGSGAAYARAYYQKFSAYVVSYKPDIIGHFDLLRKHNATLALLDLSDPSYAAAACDALDGMIESGAMLEINTGAIAKGYLPDPYPELRWLSRWRELGGRAILSSDCHDAALLDCGYGEALDLARAAGYRELWALNPQRGELFVPYLI